MFRVSVPCGKLERICRCQNPTRKMHILIIKEVEEPPNTTQAQKLLFIVKLFVFTMAKMLLIGNSNDHSAVKIDCIYYVYTRYP